MRYLKKVVLQCPDGYKPELDKLVDEFVASGVKLIAVVGKDCSVVEDIIDELVVGDGSDKHRYIVTSSHEGESVDEVIEFVTTISPELGKKAQLVEL